MPLIHGHRWSRSVPCQNAHGHARGTGVPVYVLSMNKSGICEHLLWYHSHWTFLGPGDVCYPPHWQFEPSDPPVAPGEPPVIRPDVAGNLAWLQKRMMVSRQAALSFKNCKAGQTVFVLTAGCVLCHFWDRLWRRMALKGHSEIFFLIKNVLHVNKLLALFIKYV